jgi:predicted O-methyltransferase YrrM
MRTTLEALIAELEGFGRSFDSGMPDFDRRMLNITRDTGEFLAVLVRSVRARRVLEIGTSNGYSTLWLAEAVYERGGVVTTVELNGDKFALARKNFVRSGLAPCINAIQDDAGHFLRQCGVADYDFVFLDSDRPSYLAWWPELRRVLRPGGLLVMDNAVWPDPEEVLPFFAKVRVDPEFSTCLVPSGKGEFLAAKAECSMS